MGFEELIKQGIEIDCSNISHQKGLMGGISKAIGEGLKPTSLFNV